MTTPGKTVSIRDRLVQSGEETALDRLFAPVHKSALGVAFGTTAALLIFAVTSFHVLLRPTRALQIGLLSQYFYGYDVSWGGAAIGAAWGFVTGFVAGWFVAFVRNIYTAVKLFTLKNEGELINRRDFLDRI